MKLKIILLFFALGIMSGCKKVIPLVFSSENFTEDSLELCKTIGCPEITVDYVTASGDAVVSEKINSQIHAFVIGSLSMGEDSVPKAQSIPEAASEFIKTYRMHAADFPDMSAEYFAEINVTEAYNSEELISFEMRQYLYTGGAHGFGGVQFLNINPKSGIAIPVEALFKNMIDFSLFAEKKFREVNDIAMDESINSTGFWFEDDTFYIPESVGFTPNSLILIYNAYEIASYAAGPVELEISLEEASPYLNLNL